jgi:serine/threonine-protein kinase
MNQGQRPNVPAPPAQTGSGPAQSQQPGATYFLGRYRVVDEIGIGGMASVHLARMDGPGGFQKWVAIKRIHPHLVEDDSFITMFLDEARVAARISHPNVATVFELGKEADSFWIAMEYLHGEPLREIMRRTEELGAPMPPEIACRIIADAAEGLHAAHELLGKNGEKLNLVHRDVTPHNLFVTYDGNTKVVDFGIAKFSSRMASTRAGTLKGKLAYMSPEQVAGEQLDRRTDIFALGVVLWELTTGQRLFRMDSDLDTLAKVQDCNVPKPSGIVRGYPIELERVVLKALAKNKNERYRTAREFSRALQSMLMKRGLFIASDEVSAYVKSIFGDRIEKREAHLRWAAEVTQTGESEVRATSGAPGVPDFEGSVQSYDSDVQRARTPGAGAPAAQPQPAAVPARSDFKSTMPLQQKSPVAQPGPPRPAAGAPPRPAFGGLTAPLGAKLPPMPAAAPVAPRPDPSAPLADLDSMEDDGPTIMAPTPTDEEYDESQDATIVADKPAGAPGVPPAPASGPIKAPAVRPAAGAPAPVADDEDATRAQPLPPMNAAVAHPPRPLPPRTFPDQQQAPPVVVEARPMPGQRTPQYSPAAFAPTYSPGDPSLAPPPGYMQQGPFGGQIQQPTMMLPKTKQGVPMWLVGVASAVAAMMVLVVVYLLVVPPSHPSSTKTASTGTGATVPTSANGPFGAARSSFNAAITATAATTQSSAAPTTTAPPSSTVATTATATDTAPTATATATATATTTATVATATATATATHGPTQLPYTGGNTEKGYLTLITVPKCDSWSDNGTPMGSCPIANKPLPVGTHRITLTTIAPKASKTVSVIIVAGQTTNPGLQMLQ